jgi:hypothetical protein
VFRGKKNRAQSVLEYATVIACTVAALLAMQIYIKRSMQGRLKRTADQFGPHYAPMRTTGDYTTTYTSNSVTQSITQSEVDLGYDLDGDAVLEDNVTAVRTISGYGTYTDTSGDGIIQPTEISGGTVTTRTGGETVGVIAYTDDLFTE